MGSKPKSSQVFAATTQSKPNPPAAAAQVRVSPKPQKKSKMHVQLGLLAQMAEPVLLFAAKDWRVIGCNSAACGFYGYSEAELLSHTIFSLCPQKQVELVKSKLASKVSSSRELIHLSKNGEQLFLYFEPAAVRFADQNAYLCLMHDASSRSQVMKTLLESAAMNREIIENASDIIYTHDLEGNFTSANKAVRRILGYTLEESLKLNMRDLLAQGELQRARETIERRLAGEDIGNPYQLKVATKDRRHVTLELSTRLIHKNGKPVGVQGTARDITDRVTVESALHESEAKFRAVSESAPCAILIYQGSIIRYANPKTMEMTGYSLSELLDLKEFWELAAPEYRDLIRTRSMARQSGQSVPDSYEFKIITKSGEQRWMDFTASNVTYAGVPAVVVMIFDISERKHAEEALTRSEQLFRTLVENSSDVISILDPDGIIRYESPSVATKLGYSPDELVGTNAFDYVHPQDLEQALVAFREGLVKPRRHAAVELRLLHKNGSYHFFESVSNLLRGPDGKTVGLLCSFRDIVDRRRQQAELRASEERYRDLFERNLAGVYRTRRSGDLLDCNDSFAQIFGYPSREELLRAGAGSLYFNPGDREDFIQRLSVSKSLLNQECLCKRRDGSPVWVLENVVLVPGNEGSEDILQGTLIDVTERKRAEEKILESESKFRAVADTAASAIYIHDGERFYYCNRASEEISGYAASELMGLDPFSIVHPGDHQLVADRARMRKAGHSVVDRYEYRILRKDGGIRWLDFSASVIQFGGQKAILGTAFDITERKRAESLHAAMFRIADRANQAEELPAFFAAIHQIVGELMDARNFFIALYDRATDRVSYPYFVDEVDPAPSEDFALGRGLTRYVLQTGKSMLVTPQVFDGLVAAGEVEQIGADSIDWIGVPLQADGESFGVIVLQSYSQHIRFSVKDLEILNFVSQHIANAIVRKRSQEALRESESRYRSLVHGAAYGIYRSDAQHRFVEVNPALVQMLGYVSTEELLALDIQCDVYIEPAERDLMLEELEQSGKVASREARWKRKDGKVITVRLSGRAVRDLQGRITGYEKIVEDVTERRALEEQLRQSQKMEAVGRLAGGVAHDFNNLLTVIKGYSELLLEGLTASDHHREEVEEIRKAADRAAGLTRQLLAFSRQQVLAPKVLNLNGIVSNMDRLLNRLIGEDVGLFTILEPVLGSVKADPGQIEQVIMNLAVNARDAMPRGGKLIIETANVDLDESYVLEHTSAKAGPYVMLSVSDSGLGMSDQVRQRIFEPFFTTKEMGKGTGLGLSTVYGIVKQSEGCIWVYSEIGVGTAFKVYLPRVDAPAEPIVQKSLPLDLHGSETVLLVEDEDGVRALVRQVLHKHGYTVLEARDGAEAFRQCERHAKPIDLLLTDVVLEHMSGRELAEKLSSLRPEMKVLYISGYTDDAVVHHGVLSAGKAFLQKPFTTDALARKVRQVLAPEAVR